MESIFESVTLTYDGHDYVVPPEKVFGLVETVEGCIKLENISELENGIPRTKIARAYHEALKYAGCHHADVSHIYQSLFQNEGADIQTVINTITMLLVPPEVLREFLSDESATSKKKEVKPKPKATTRAKPRQRKKT